MTAQIIITTLLSIPFHKVTHNKACLISTVIMFLWWVQIQTKLQVETFRMVNMGISYLPPIWMIDFSSKLFWSSLIPLKCSNRSCKFSNCKWDLEWIRFNNKDSFQCRIVINVKCKINVKCINKWGLRKCT